MLKTKYPIPAIPCGKDTAFQVYSIPRKNKKQRPQTKIKRIKKCKEKHNEMKTVNKGVEIYGKD